MLRRSSRIRSRLSESSVTDSEYHSDVSSICSENEVSLNGLIDRKKTKILKHKTSKSKSKKKTYVDENSHDNHLKRIIEEETPTNQDSQNGKIDQNSDANISNEFLSLNTMETSFSCNQPSNFKLVSSKTFLDYLTVEETKKLGVVSDFILQNDCSNIPFLSQLRKRHGGNIIEDDAGSDVFGLHMAEISIEQDSDKQRQKNSAKEIQVSSDLSLSEKNSSAHKLSSKYLEKNSKKQVDELMTKSVLPDNLESLEKAPKLFESSAAIKRERQKKRQETAGKGWFNMPKPELTEEVKRDLQVIQMRNALDTKRHYRRADSKKLPTFFQVGTIVEGAHEFHSARVSKKQRKRTIVDELLADAEFRRKNKKRFIEIQKKNVGGGKGHYKKMKNKRKQTWSRT